ncbi:hypothetical protein IL54_4397 [Sphingobium sp. ba1]|nr:hypothetical protein IL54_4397 [Sphingobium sp. ba1]
MLLLAEILILLRREVGQFVLARTLTHHGIDRLALTIADQHDRHARADGLRRDDGGEILFGADFLARDADDHVACLDPGLLRALARLDTLYELAAILGEAKRFGQIFTQRADLHAQIAATHGFALAQRFHDRGGLFRRNGKADADIAARRRQNLAVDADHIAAHVEHRATGIALVDRCVGLDELLVPATGIAMHGRDDPGGHRARQGEWVADRDDPVADPRLGAVAEFDEGQGLGRIDLQYGQVRRGIATHQLGGIFRLVGQRDGDRIHRRAFGARRHHMVIGDNIAVRRNQEARPQRLRLPRLRLATALAEQLAERRARKGILHLDPLLGRNIDHGGLQFLDHVSQACRRALRGGCGQAFILCGLGADIGTGGNGNSGAAQQQGAGDGISVTHS